MHASSSTRQFSHSLPCIAAPTSSDPRLPRTWKLYGSFCHLHKPIKLVSSSTNAAGRNRPKYTDDMLDDLLKEHGKVVFKRNDRKTSREDDNDAEILSFAIEMAKVAKEVKASDIRVLFVKPVVYWTQYFIIATAFSRPQIDALGSKIRDLAEQQYGKVATGDFKPNSWTLLDFGEVVIHIFLPQQRAYYNLEGFYGNAPLIALPFENPQPGRVEL